MVPVLPAMMSSHVMVPVFPAMMSFHVMVTVLPAMMSFHVMVPVGGTKVQTLKQQRFSPSIKRPVKSKNVCNNERFHYVMSLSNTLLFHQVL